MTRIAALVAAVALAAGLADSATADQKDPQLPGLFVRLRTAESTDAAQPVEADIWRLSLQAGRLDADRLLARGVVAMEAGAYDAALDQFGQLVQVAPDFAEGWNKRATVLFLLGRYADSIKDIDQVLRLEPRHFGALSGLAMCDEQLGRNTEALRALQRVAAIYPHMAGLQDRIADLQKKVEGQPI